MRWAWRRVDPRACDLLYVGGGQDREQALDRFGLGRKSEAIHSAQRVASRCSRSAVGTSSSVAATAAATARSCRASAFSARDPRRCDAHDRGRPPRMRARSRREARTRRIRESRRANPARPRSGAARARLVRVRQRRGVRARGMPARQRASGRTFMARCFHGIRGWPTGFFSGTRACDRQASYRRSSHARTSWKPRRFALPRNGHGSEAGVARSGIPEGHPSPPPTVSLTRKGYRWRRNVPKRVIDQ